MKARIILFGFSLLTFWSCVDREEFENRTESPVMGVLQFKSHSDFKKITDQIPTMTEAELDSWEKENNFISYRSVLKQAYMELDLITSNEQYSGFLRKYDDILVLQDSSIVPKIDIPLTQAFVNREGIYQTDIFFHKIIGNYVVITNKDNLQRLREVKTYDEKSFKDSGFKFFNFRDGSIKLYPNAKNNATCSKYHIGYFWLNESGCKNDREAWVIAESYQYINSYQGGTYYNPRVRIQVYGKIRNWLCNWNNYATQYEFRSANIEIWQWERVSMSTSATVSQPKFYILTPPNMSIDDGTSTKLEWDVPVGDWRFNENYGTNPFTTLYVQGKSRGIGNNWITLSCP